MRRAVFVDRDGVLIHDVDVLTKREQLRLFDDVPRALGRIKALGFAIVVVTNQPAVARGLVTEAEIDAIHRALHEMVPDVDAFYVCPHHPKATLESYRVDCDCRKPAPGMLLRAAAEMGLDLAKSYMIGDRASDVLAGHRAGCHTILLETGMHAAKPIETSPRWAGTAVADETLSRIGEAADYIAERER